MSVCVCFFPLSLSLSLSLSPPSRSPFPQLVLQSIYFIERHPKLPFLFFFSLYTHTYTLLYLTPRLNVNNLTRRAVMLELFTKIRHRDKRKTQRQYDLIITFSFCSLFLYFFISLFLSWIVHRNLI